MTFARFHFATSLRISGLACMLFAAGCGSSPPAGDVEAKSTDDALTGGGICPPPLVLKCQAHQFCQCVQPPPPPPPAPPSWPQAHLIGGSLNLMTGRDLKDLLADDFGTYFTMMDSNLDGAIYHCSSVGCPAPAPEPMYSGKYITSLQQDSMSLYWVEGMSKLLTCWKSNCAQTLNTLVVDLDRNLTGKMAIDDSNVYFIANGYAGAGTYLEKCPKAGCQWKGTRLTAVPAGTQPGGVVRDGTDLYYVPPSRTSIWVCSLTDSCASPRALISNAPSRIADFVVDGTNVFYQLKSSDTAVGSVMRCAKSGCNDTPHVEAAGVDFTSYDYGTIMAVSISGLVWQQTTARGTGIALREERPASQPPVQWLIGENEAPTPIASSVTIHGTDLYWTDPAQGAIYRALF